MFTHTLRVISLMLSLALAGCAGSGDSTSASYLLPDIPTGQQHDARLLVVVAPISMAAFLEGDGIVMQLNDLEVHQARNHLWAEPLPGQLRQLLMDGLSETLPNSQVIARGQPGPGNLPVREVHLQLDRFQGRYDGMAMIRGRWQLLDKQGQLLKQQGFEVEAPLHEDGYPALVRALASGWKQVTNELAADITLSN